MKKYQVVAVILLFIGVAIAPSVNSSVVKTSADNDLVEVTSQACGVQGFGNTMVKLTKQQYEDLEQYLVEFRARLNQTTSREEAVPIFKEAVVELNKYGLLPKGMSVEKAQKLVIGRPFSSSKLNNLRELLKNNRNDNATNYFCSVTATTTSWYNTASLNPVTLGGIAVAVIGGGITMITWAPPDYFGPSAIIGVPILILGLLIASYGQFKPFLPFCFLIILFSNTTYFTSGLLGVKQGFSPGDMAISGFIGFEIKSFKRATYLGWAVHTM
ncbi:MAG TPA: hypothetical protein VMT57_03945 [Candidatus Thermoplasmatota archaeon]|nr:hypothetical protein [Candidatus Thermoplasmatota archaeon]